MSNQVNMLNKTKSRKFYLVNVLGVKMSIFILIASFILCVVGLFIKQPSEIAFNTWKIIVITYIVNVVIQVVGYFLFNTKQKREVDKDIIMKMLDK